MKPAGGSVTATLISSDGSTSSGREYTSYISFSAHYGDRLSLSYVSEGGYTFEGWVVSKAGAIDDASKQSTYMTVRGDSRVEVRVGGLESAVIRLSVDGEAPGGSITLTGDGRTYTVRQSSVDGEYGVFSVSALLGEYALSYGGSGFGTITVVSGGVSGSYRLVSLELEVTPDADVGALPSYAVPGTQLALDIPHGYSVSKLTLGYDGVDHDMGAVSGFTVPSAQSTGVTVKVELETSNYTIEFVVDFIGSDGSKVVFDKVASITVEYSPDGTVYPELPWVQLNGLDLNALDRETTSPYSFLGWYLDEGFMQRVQAGDAFPEEDVVLHASIADRKEIIYVVNVYMMGIGGDYPDTPTYEIQTIELENQYVGWRPDYPGFAVDVKMSSDYENTVVEAGMDNLNIYMVRASGTAVLDPVGGTVSESGGWTLDEEGKLTREVWYGETVTLPVPVKTENVFGRWSVDDSTVTQVTVGDGMWDRADNTVFFEGTAQWTVNEYRLVLSTLYGTFSNGQTTMTVSVPYGTSLSDVLDRHRAELEKEAGMYADFGGWIPAPPDTMPADTLTLTAQWTPKKVSITVTGDEHVTISVSGGSLTGSDGSYESVFNGSMDLMLSFDSGYSLYEATGAKEQPVRKSAVQFEWTVPLNGGNITVGDDGSLSIVLEVTSVESAVTVTYVINGTPAASLFQNVPSGENVVLHDLSALQGLTFDGWYSDPEMKNRIEGNTISFVDADDREVVYGSLTADKPTGHITAGDLVLDNGVYVGTYNGGRHTLTAVPDTYAEGSTPLDYDLTYRIIWGDTENKTVSFTNAGDYSVTLTVTATLAIGGTVSDVSEPHTEDFEIRIDKADAEVVWVHDDAYVYNGTDRSGTVYAYYVGMDGRNHQLSVSFPDSFTDVGDYRFTVPGEDSNHIFSNTELHLSIGEKVLTITQSGSLSYNGQAQSPADQGIRQHVLSAVEQHGPDLRPGRQVRALLSDQRSQPLLRHVGQEIHLAGIVELLALLRRLREAEGQRLRPGEILVVVVAGGQGQGLSRRVRAHLIGPVGHQCRHIGPPGLLLPVLLRVCLRSVGGCVLLRLHGGHQVLPQGNGGRRGADLGQKPAVGPVQHHRQRVGILRRHLEGRHVAGLTHIVIARHHGQQGGLRRVVGRVRQPLPCVDEILRPQVAAVGPLPPELEGAGDGAVGVLLLADALGRAVGHADLAGCAHAPAHQSLVQVDQDRPVRRAVGVDGVQLLRRAAGADAEGKRLPALAAAAEKGQAHRRRQQQGQPPFPLVHVIASLCLGSRAALCRPHGGRRASPPPSAQPHAPWPADPAGRAVESAFNYKGFSAACKAARQKK